MLPDAVRRGERVPHGGEPDRDVLDFSANTNPETPDGVEEVYTGALEQSRRYPDDDYPEFRTAAAEFVGCEPDRVIPTSGGLAAIRLAIEVTLEEDETALVPYPSFGEYAREVRLQGATPQFVRHDDLLEVGVDLLADVDLAVVCTPNNPTGTAADPDALEAFAVRCAEAGTTLLVDEAFLGFTDLRSAATFDHENVIVARSLTKLFGLPGLRAGFAVASGERRDALETARRAWSLGTPATRVGTYCLRQEAFVRETRERVASERERMRRALERRFDVSHSDAPYLVCDVGDRSVSGVLESAREDGVAVRDATTFRGLDSHVRVAVKDRESNERLLAALDAPVNGETTDR
ncbi:threonine-phosphate decarboxylase CobD [Natronobacterium gregoryi]|uniref:threonine-phosphate decarboxylase n=2 Tax=Natronobacterium gregoryi TaxID=44930 RepID=L0ALH7_NATGS|nr:threonine-phosphate decarboxylase CobD [Natronobacterium gregoryi]AFZ73910.1 L-threonine-O-3-phosphate decarboxylase [Natronobacterium gregoryi SP2]ELY71568.1 L-threonine-O-3-phosphate decarboxylase [Natronobacterium gregoryi SP2]PLK19053.1 threonine-phosphate decarboxylase [Natronobacterium gregoryi SP2]SFJ62940.1 L-threonine O-3-phosphate decarboxylase [Natronobacterium gregoryi]